MICDVPDLWYLAGVLLIVENHEIHSLAEFSEKSADMYLIKKHCESSDIFQRKFAMSGPGIRLTI